MLIGIIVTVLVVAGAGAFLVIQKLTGSHAAGAGVNMDCTLIVPKNPLTAEGLATPYQLVATDANNGPCNETNGNQTAFVQGAVFDTKTGQISAYNPLVIDKGTQPAIAPVIPTLPQRAVVALWFGFNGNNLILQGTGNSLRTGKCVNGVNGSIFGQFSYCNAPAFFRAAKHAVANGQLVPPALGIGKDGQACPTVRDFSVVDQDQSDNVTTAYLVSDNNQVAQLTAANMAQVPNAQILKNGSDNRLLSVAIDGALGCTPWKVADLADPGQTVPSLPLNEIQAAALQAKPIALVPNFDPMVLVNNQRNMNKLNAYRAGVDQPQVGSPQQASGRAYCLNLMNVAPARLALDAQFTSKAASLDAAVANNLFNFLGQRFAATWTNLTCQQLTGKASPITVKTDENGVATETMINGVNMTPQTGKALNCTVNGTVIAGCTGTTIINGQTCSLALDANTNQVNITCPALKNVDQPITNKQEVKGQDVSVDPVQGGKDPKQVKNE
ncbi:MAG: hypothetical protein PVS3B3_10530 [Ktedonobacteraceae bacterium]